jgi:S-(hydroxymethyl)glutathione dehydrogenase/alcohol dehydrogenase
MRAVTWQGVENVRVEDVADPISKEPTDAAVEITSTAICGSDLHLYRPLAPFMEPGDILGHEPMGRVVPVGDDVRQIAVGHQP